MFAAILGSLFLRVYLPVPEWFLLDSEEEAVNQLAHASWQ